MEGDVVRVLSVVVATGRADEMAGRDTSAAGRTDEREHGPDPETAWWTASSDLSIRSLAREFAEEVVSQNPWSATVTMRPTETHPN